MSEPMAFLKRKVVANDTKSATTMVGVAGLEPTASWSRTKRSTKLSYTPVHYETVSG